MTHEEAYISTALPAKKMVAWITTRVFLFKICAQPHDMIPPFHIHAGTRSSCSVNHSNISGPSMACGCLSQAEYFEIAFIKKWPYFVVQHCWRLWWRTSWSSVDVRVLGVHVGGGSVQGNKGHTQTGYTQTKAQSWLFGASSGGLSNNRPITKKTASNPSGGSGIALYAGRAFCASSGKQAPSQPPHTKVEGPATCLKLHRCQQESSLFFQFLN